MDLLNDTRDTYARHVWEGICVEVSCARSKEESNRLNITWTQVSRANVKVREEWQVLVVRLFFRERLCSPGIESAADRPNGEREIRAIRTATTQIKPCKQFDRYETVCVSYIPPAYNRREVCNDDVYCICLVSVLRVICQERRRDATRRATDGRESWQDASINNVHEGII